MWWGARIRSVHESFRGDCFRWGRRVENCTKNPENGRLSVPVWTGRSRSTFLPSGVFGRMVGRNATKYDEQRWSGSGCGIGESDLEPVTRKGFSNEVVNAHDLLKVISFPVDLLGKDCRGSVKMKISRNRQRNFTVWRKWWSLPKVDEGGTDIRFCGTEKKISIFSWRIGVGNGIVGPKSFRSWNCGSLNEKARNQWKTEKEMDNTAVSWLIDADCTRDGEVGMGKRKWM